MKATVKKMSGRLHTFCGVAIYKDNAEFGIRWVIPEFYLDDLTPFNGNDCMVNITHDADIEISLLINDEASPQFKKPIKIYEGNLLRNKQFCEILKQRMTS